MEYTNHVTDIRLFVRVKNNNVIKNNTYNAKLNLYFHSLTKF